MTEDLKKSLDQIRGMIGKFNAGKYANEEAFVDELRPEILKAAAEIEKPKKEQARIE